MVDYLSIFKDMLGRLYRNIHVNKARNIDINTEISFLCKISEISNSILPIKLIKNVLINKLHKNIKNLRNHLLNILIFLIILQPLKNVT